MTTCTLPRTKDCTKCGSEKSQSEFTKCGRSKDGLHWWCKSCTRSYANERNRRVGIKYDPDIKRRQHYKYKYGITVDEYESMLSAQDGVCAICLAPPNDQSVKKRLAVDHNHATGRVRGLLCERCNRAIGLLGDSRALLKTAIDYLKDDE